MQKDQQSSATKSISVSINNVEPQSPYITGLGSENAFYVEDKFKDDFYIGSFYDEPDYDNLQQRKFGSFATSNDEFDFDMGRPRANTM